MTLQDVKKASQLGPRSYLVHPRSSKGLNLRDDFNIPVFWTVLEVLPSPRHGIQERDEQLECCREDHSGIRKLILSKPRPYSEAHENTACKQHKREWLLKVEKSTSKKLLKMLL